VHHLANFRFVLFLIFYLPTNSYSLPIRLEYVLRERLVTGEYSNSAVLNVRMCDMPNQATRAEFQIVLTPTEYNSIRAARFIHPPSSKGTLHVLPANTRASLKAKYDLFSRQHKKVKIPYKKLQVQAVQLLLCVLAFFLWRIAAKICCHSRFTVQKIHKSSNEPTFL